MIRPAAALLLLSATTVSAEDGSVFALYDHFALAQVVGEACTHESLARLTAGLLLGSLAQLLAQELLGLLEVALGLLQGLLRFGKARGD